MRVELLDKSKKKKILNLLEENYGVSDLKYLFIKSGKDKIRVFSGSLSKEEINDLAKNTNVELIGSRLCNLTGDGIRINFDIINLPEIKSQITENIQILDDKEAIDWMKGNDLQIVPKNEAKFFVIKNNSDFLGVGRNNKSYIKNYIPKERRIR